MYPVTAIVFLIVPFTLAQVGWSPYQLKGNRGLGWSVREEALSPIVSGWIEQGSKTIEKKGERDTEIPPELLSQVISDLAGRLGVSPEKVEVLAVKKVRWKDRSLGCPEKGAVYLQVITPGFRIILKARGREYDYRVAGQGYFKLCEGELTENR